MRDSSPSRKPRIRRFLALSVRDKLLVLRCVPIVAAVRLGLSLLSYKTIKRWIRFDREVRPAPTEELRRLAWGIRNAARLVPRASCLTQALAAQFLLARSGYRSQIRVGVVKDAEGRFCAHAWLISDDRVVVGGSRRDLQRYTPLTDLEAGTL